MSVYDIIKNRRTIRKFSQNPIDKEVLLKCIDAARVSPCGANKQPLKYKIINDFETVQQICPLVRWAAYISPYGNPTKDEQPTAFIAVTVDTNIKPNGYETDTGIAMQSIVLVAEENNIGSCLMGAIDHTAISQILKLPENLKLLYVIALGYKAEQPKECTVIDDDIKYFKDENGVINVPKRSMQDIII